MAHTQTKTPTKSAEFIIAHNRSFEESLLRFQKSILIRSQQLFVTNFRSLSALKSTIVNKSRDILDERKNHLRQCRETAIHTTQSILFTRRNGLVSIASQLLSQPRIIVSNRMNDIRNHVSNLKIFHTAFIKHQRAYIAHYVSVVRLVSPENTLRRGFAIIKHEDKIIGNAEGIGKGDKIAVIFSGNELQATVQSKSEYHGNEFDL